MGFLGSKGRYRLVPTLTLVAVVLLAAWMGDANGGYFVKDWALDVFLLATLVLVASLTGALRGPGSRWVSAALGLFAGYAAWTFASLLWSPNKGEAWIGAGQTLLYLLVFGTALFLLRRGSSRRWVLAASVLGPAVVAAFTLTNPIPDLEALFSKSRLLGTVGYFNGEAAFLLVPFWVAIYLAGSRRTNPILRGLVLGGATLGAEVAVLTQSRGALVAMLISSVTFFALSGQRLRGFLALTPIAVALFVSFQDLNGVYLAFSNEEDPTATLARVAPMIWLASITVGLYGLVWGLVDLRWRPSAVFARASGAAVLIAFVAACVLGAVVFVERVGSPGAWGAQEWEAFKTENTGGQEQSRYLDVSSPERYTLWQVAWEDFASHPILGIGTYNYEATYYRLRERTAGYARQPHMLPLEVISERGVVGGVLFFGFLLTCLVAGLKQRFKYLRAEGKALVGAVVAALVYWFVHSSSDWLWQIPAATVPAMIYLAVLVAPWNEEAASTPSLWPPRAIGVGAALLAVAVVAPLYVADRYLAQSYAATNPWVALDDVERAQKFNPLNPQLPQREAELRMQIGDWPRVERAYDRAIELNPEHYAPYTLLAKFREQRGEPEKALSSYQRALTLNPLDKDLKGSIERLEG